MGFRMMCQRLPACACYRIFKCIVITWNALSNSLGNIKSTIYGRMTESHRQNSDNENIMLFVMIGFLLGRISDIQWHSTPHTHTQQTHTHTHRLYYDDSIEIRHAKNKRKFNSYIKYISNFGVCMVGAVWCDDVCWAGEYVVSIHLCTHSSPWL